MFEIVKVDTTERLVFGFANIAVKSDGTLLRDRQGDEIEPAALEKAAYDFVLDFAECGEMHKGVATGQLVESVFITPDKLVAWGLEKTAIQPRWWVGFKVDVPTFEKVKNRTFKMFSIQGKVLDSETV